jgi:transposase
VRGAAAVRGPGNGRAEDALRRHALGDARWAQSADLMPRNRGRGGRWRDHRRIVNGMFWKLTTGAPRRDIPGRCGPWPTIAGRFVRWRADGTLARIIERLRMPPDQAGRIDRDLGGIAGTAIRAGRAAAGARKGGLLARASRPTTRSGARAAASAASCTW